MNLIQVAQVGVHWWTFVNTSGFRERQGISLVAERFSVYQEGLCCMDLASHCVSLLFEKPIFKRFVESYGASLPFISTGKERIEVVLRFKRVKKELKLF
jgi:hypothetical protein